MRRIFLPVCFSILIFVAGGCATRVVPPVNPPRATTIYLCDYGVHSSLLLPTENGQFVEYVYGDWQYAALNKTDVWHTLVSLFCSGEPALGRRFLKADDKGVPQLPNKPNSRDPILVDADLIKQVVKQMDDRWNAHKETAHFNDYPGYYFTFVRDDVHYSILHSCNHLTSGMLKQMDCRIGGYPIGSNFIVTAPGNPPK